MPDDVASKISFFLPSVRPTQPSLSPSLTRTKVNVCAEGPGNSEIKLFLTIPKRVAVMTQVSSPRDDLLAGSENTAASGSVSASGATL